MSLIPTIAWKGCEELQTIQIAQTQDSKNNAFPRIIRHSINLQTHVIGSLIIIYLFIIYLKILSVARTIQCWMVRRLMNKELERVEKDANLRYYPKSAQRNWRKPQKTSVKTADVPAKILTSHLRDISLKGCHLSASPIPALHPTAVISNTCVVAACAVTVRLAQPIKPWMMWVAILSATMMAWIECAETWWTWARRMETSSVALRP